MLLVTAYWRTNLTLRQLAPLFGVSKSTAGRVINRLGPLLALRPRKRFAKDTVLIVDATLVPTRDHQVAEQSKNYRYSTNHQVVVDADPRLVVAVGRTTVIADGGYRGTGAPTCSSRTAANPARSNSRPGKKNTTARTARSAPGSSTSSPA